MTEKPPLPNSTSGSQSERSSRISGFYRKPLSERIALVADWAQLEEDQVAALQDCLSMEQADVMIENVAGRYALPLGIGTNFQINHRDYLVPMVVEESSVVAAVSNAARLARTGGGFVTGSTDPVMIAQIQLLDVPDMAVASERIAANTAELLRQANTSPSIAARGGGPVGIKCNPLTDTPAGEMLIVHLLFDTRDAMGANAVNTSAETIAPRLEELSGGRALLRILSNLSDQRRAWAETRIPVSAFSRDGVDGADVANAISEANAFAVADPYRAATHNKGIMNGIDAVAVATGNDWRAVEAGAHAYAARNGQYRALTDWTVEPSALPADRSADVDRSSRAATLHGRLELPLAVGTVGGATRSHPTARVAMQILGVQSARELAEVMAAVGLAQNLAALRALVTDGIQRGHMSLHARQVAVAAGAAPDQVERIATQLVQEGQIREERARELLQLLK